MTRYLLPSVVDRWTWQEVTRMHASRMTPRMVAAHHEAAHAIAAICAGRIIDRIEVSDRGNGACRIGWGQACNTTEQWLRWIASQMKIAAAGQAAQRWVDPHTMFLGASDDREKIERLRGIVERITGDSEQAEELLADSRREAEELIDEFWPFVQKIARELDVRARMTGDEIWELLGGKPGGKTGRKPAVKTADEPGAVPYYTARCDGYIIPPRAPQRNATRGESFSFARDFNFPVDPREHEVAARAFRRRHGGRDYIF